MKSARLCAFEILDGVIRNNAYSNIAVDKSARELSAADRAFVSQLVFGVIERRLTLEYIVSQFLTQRTKPKVKIILYIGAYQLYYMDKVPASAAINETVKLCTDAGAEFFKPLVNAVLHKIDKNRIDTDSIENEEIRYSCPQSLINMWIKQYGGEAAKSILETLNEKPPVFAVPNTLFLDSDELIYELMLEGVECEKAGDIVKILSPLNIAKSKSFERGLYHIEDMSSYLCAMALGAEEGDTVIDVCSAPGGKAFTIAQSMNGKGKVYALDIHPHRVELIKQGAERLSLSNIITAVNDAEKYNSDLPMADKIICDVPCSGFGVIRRKPEIRYKELDSVKDLPELQYNILLTSSKYLKASGRLIYSTCTLNKKENEKVVERFIEENPGFVLVSTNTVIPSKDGGDGFFHAVIEKV